MTKRRVAGRLTIQKLKVQRAKNFSEIKELWEFEINTFRESQIFT